MMQNDLVWEASASKHQFKSIKMLMEFERMLEAKWEPSEPNTDKKTYVFSSWVFEGPQGMAVS